MKLNRNNRNKGMAIIAALIFVAVSAVLTGSYLLLTTSEGRMTKKLNNAKEALYVAEGGLDIVKREINQNFRVYFNTTGARLPSSFTWFDTLTAAGPPYTPPSNAGLGNGTYTVAITVVSNPDGLIELGNRDVTMKITGSVNGRSKIITSTVRYSLAPSSVFDYAYFINNFGWFWGNTIDTHGDVRSNGDFSFGSYAPLVNGDVFAAVNTEIGAAGDIIGTNTWQAIDPYRASAPNRARPSNPTANSEDTNDNGVLDAGEDTNGNGILDDFAYPNGYDGQSDHSPNQEIVDMPYLGDLQAYKDLAVAKNGTVKQGGVTLVNNVLDDTGIVLIGTAANPIVIDGLVVVTGDVLIKGVVTGQGTIYSGRNTHVIGDIEYKNPPVWIKPDVNPDTTDTTNAGKDFLGLASKGNVVLGDYTGTDWNYTKNYLSPPFTNPYIVDSSDAANGYVSYTDGDGNPWFNGDYTAFDGGTKSDGSARRYYESTFPDAFFASVANARIYRMDAVSYTNHAFTGRPDTCAFNGSIISRDEALIYNNSITMNYDLRAKDPNNFFWLPRTLADPTIISWKED